jgi:hypothetical protein
MRYEIDLFGVLMPSLMLWLVITYAMGALLRPLIERSSIAMSGTARCSIFLCMSAC